LIEPKTEDEVIKSLYHENKKIRKNLRDLSEHLSTQLEKQKLNILRAHKQVSNDNPASLIPGLSKYNPRDIEQSLYINEV
jgi:phosphoenolpyruvate-protein kinase (PTS system EI component)